MPSPVRCYQPDEFIGSPAFAAFLRRRDLACQDADPETFAIVGDERLMANRRRIAAAKKVCAGCPAKLECARFAIEDYTDSWMVRGGLTPNERVELRRRARLAGAA